jgi:transcription initiation factor TFIIB
MTLEKPFVRDCGLVLYEQMMDKGPEWRAFTQEEKASRSRVGVPTSYSVHDKGLVNSHKPS